MLLKEFMTFNTLLHFRSSLLYALEYTLKFHSQVELLPAGLEILIDKVKFYEMCWISLDGSADDS